ncbi:hypothetical protein CLMAG_29330 [Clostridium magnum DSM 2767]|uniref:Uncharacterized protein n=1 Tax=Clostridium magnum DSM 2767 TaxID=1121326 RepID=A0A161WHK9_9CLOT|nr:hypothetical protein CLMAG_29330 [Clostridium magnum DSM 2767]SHI17616.1 hypothetical protein SAMN02745944_02933 [Clostridium magnum DSM 2767]
MVEACEEAKKEESLGEACEKGIMMHSLNHKQAVNCVKVLSGLGIMALSTRVVPRIYSRLYILETGFYNYNN